MSVAVSEHDWAERRFAAYCTAMLDDDAMSRMAAHIDQCDRCASRFDEFRAQSTVAEKPHLPNSLVKGWANRNARLKGLERHLIRGHLESCAECRGLLEMFGHRPVLEVVPELEANDLVLAALREAPKWKIKEESEGGLAKGVEPVRRTATDPRGPGLRERWRTLLAGGALGGGMVAAAATLLAVFGVVHMQWGGDERSASIPPLTPPSSQATPFQLGFTPGEAQVLLGNVTRGTGSTEPDVVIEPGQRTLRINLSPEPGIPATARAHIELIDPEGRVVDEISLGYGLLMQPGYSLELVSPAPLEPGHWLLRLSWKDADGNDQRQESRFHLVRP